MESALLSTETAVGPVHHFLVYVGDEVRVCPSPAPDYRAADKFDYPTMMATPQIRPLALTDMIAFVPYRPGSVVFSQFHGSVRRMLRVVGWVEPEIRNDARASLAALLDRENAAGRVALRQVLTAIIQERSAAPKEWSITIPEIEQSRITTLIL